MKAIAGYYPTFEGAGRNYCCAVTICRRVNVSVPLPIQSDIIDPNNIGRRMGESGDPGGRRWKMGGGVMRERSGLAIQI